ncbi:MAG: insulinase family protein, partial [Chloroflexi bacterium]|nr:insulinase family protein [Chloroflexota bacterium]
SPASWVHQIIEEVRFGDHPLGWDIAGTVESVSAIGRADMLAYTATRYVPNNLVVAVAGNLDHAEVVAAVAAHFGDLAPRPVTACEPAADNQTAPRLRVQNKETEQANFCLCVPGLNYDHPDRYTQRVLNAILGDGMGSRLFQEVREVRGLAYAVGSYLTSYRDAGAMTAYASVDLGRVVETVETIRGEWDRIAREPVAPEELKRAKEYTKGRFLLSMEDSRSVAAWIGIQEVRNQEILTPEQAVTEMDAVTREDVQRLASELFQPERLNLAIIGPYENPALFQHLINASAPH